jgi:hypothetical protein
MNDALTAVWQKDPALAWREIDGETVIISPGESVMHELNDTGSSVWQYVDGQRTAAQIASLLSSEYEVTPEVALSDTESLLQQLAALRLITPAGAAGAAHGGPGGR